MGEVEKVVERLQRGSDKVNEATTLQARNDQLEAQLAEALLPEELSSLIAQLRRDIAWWENAYPLRAFPEPDLPKAAAVLKAAGMTLDAISASNMSHVVSRLAPLIHDAIAALETYARPIAALPSEDDVERVAFKAMLVEAGWPDLDDGAAECGLAEDAWDAGKAFAIAAMAPEHPWLEP